MTRILPALHDGHAPFQFHQAFADALDAFEEWLPGQAEPTVLLEGVNVPISAIFGRMRTCFDILPSRLNDIVGDITGEVVSSVGDGGQPTYADAAHALRAFCVDRIKSEAGATEAGSGGTWLRRALA
jgi:hypothetical protein